MGPYPTLPVTATSLNLTWAVGDVAGNYITTATGVSYLLLVHNTHATLAKTFTITSVADTLLRTGDITSYSVGAGLYSHFYFSSVTGWSDGSSHIVITPQTTDIQFLVVSF